jgi:hypothetical protein
MQYPPLTPQPPPVWKWYVAYCALMALVFLAVAIMGVVFFFVDPVELEMSSSEATLMSVTFFVFGLVLLIPFAVAPFLPHRKSTWIIGIVLICIGMTSTCCLPISIPLLIFWIKSENKVYFYNMG